MHSHPIKDKSIGQIKSSSTIVFTADQKAIIDAKLAEVENESIVGYCINVFVEKKEKTDSSYQNFLSELGDCIAQHPKAMQRVLAHNYSFFLNLVNKCN